MTKIPIDATDVLIMREEINMDSVSAIQVI